MAKPSNTQILFTPLLSAIPLFKNKEDLFGCAIFMSCPFLAVADSLLAWQRSVGERKKKKIVFEEEVKSLDELKVMKGCQEKKLGEASWLPDTVEVPPQVDTTAEKCYLRIPLS